MSAKNKLSTPHINNKHLKISTNQSAKLDNPTNDTNYVTSATSEKQQYKLDSTEFAAAIINNANEIYGGLINSFYSTIDLSTQNTVTLLQESINCNNIDDFLSLRQKLVSNKVDLLHYATENYTKNIQNYISNCCSMTKIFLS